MPPDDRSDQPDRKRAFSRDTTDAALFRALLVIAALGVWLIASSAGSILGDAYQPSGPASTLIYSEPSAD
ncbi:MAG: hypothetical protein AAGI10_14235 [Pseudomonadota bacterium]